ncbi:MAG: two pore domain potassium channel family protein [Planctomycetaceae bacterium]|nr:two pore domain potassium channel family protein [Planctomycetaceae bacterium]
MTEQLRIQLWLERLQPFKYRLLLVSLLFLSILSHAPKDFSLTKILHSIFLQVALVTCVIAVSQYRRLFWISVGLAVIAFSDISLEYLDDDQRIHTSTLVMSSLFFGLLAVTFLYDVFKATSITVDEICGALCVYLMIGVIWSYFFAITLVFNPDAIAFPETNSQDAHLAGTLTYFSFVTLTTLGYGDIQPVSSLMRTLCWLEAVIGQIYMTVLIARLVGLNLNARSKSTTE